MEDATVRWLRLDNAAKIFPAVSGVRETQYFRLAVRLDAPVDPARLGAALRAVLPAYPLFQTRLRPGFFWFTLEQERAEPTLVPDGRWPCMPLRRGHEGRHLFRVRWHGRRLAVEFHHSLTDGTGALEFARSLAACYLKPDTALRQGDLAEQGVDEFQNLRAKGLPKVPRAGKAWQVPFPLADLGVYHVTTGRLPLDATLALAKGLGLTLSEFLAATFLGALQEVAERHGPPGRPLRLTLPVNLRKVFPSRTLRNFFAVVPIEIDLRLGHYDFDELARQVHHQLQAEMDEKLLRKQVARNLRGEDHPVGRFLPLALKNLILGTVFGGYEVRQTSNLSNLGRVEPLEATDLAVRDWEFVPPPSRHNKVKLGVISCGNALSLTFGNLTGRFDVERSFFTQLRRRGLPVAVESNRLFPEE